ncbi:MAG: GNAT family N-acetyltransferase [Peptococcaceae bacterium]|nr:GNAT family N-acetyltransferase [Peptococcaceae bacterium]
MEKVYQLIDGTVHIRTITAADDAAIAAIIRDNLRAAHLDIPGTAYFDPELEHLSVFYDAAPGKRGYYIITDDNGCVVGGVGFAEFEGVANCAELQKLYLDDTVKGRGLGHLLMETVEEGAREAGYKKFYLETHTCLETACALYEKHGYESIEQPVPTPHTTMNRFYIKTL